MFNAYFGRSKTKIKANKIESKEEIEEVEKEKEEIEFVLFKLNYEKITS